MTAETPLEVQKIRREIAKHIANGALDERVPFCLMTPDGFVPKECELWDYKETANSDALSKAKTVLQVVSFYNAYGGYILYGVAETDNKENYLAKGISPNCVDEQQLRASVKEYTGETIDFSYREMLLSFSGKHLSLGILHIPKRATTDSPLFFGKNGPETKPGSPLFQKDQAYVRVHDNCVLARDKKAFQFLFGPRELDTDCSEDHLRVLASREMILDHNLPDRSMICSRFFGRDAIIERLWLWLSDEFSKTRVLAGDGGKGKTSIAYEFCEEVCRARPFELVRVFWVTAKQKQFSGMRNEYFLIPETHFFDLNSLLRVLCLSFAMLEEEVDQTAPRLLKKNLQKALRLFPSLVVVDDIDSVQDLDEQKRILELCSEVSASTPSRFLLTTRMNLTSSSDVCITVPGLPLYEYKPYVNYLNEIIQGSSVSKQDMDLLWHATEGSPLFTESVFRLMNLGVPLSKAISEWKGKLGEEVRMAALHREISKLSPEARRVLLSCTYMGEAAMVELKQVTGYDDARMTNCIADLRSLFLLSAPEIIKEVPRFKVPGNTSRLVIEIEKELVADPAGLRKTIENLRGKKTLGKTTLVGKAIAQGIALLREQRFGEAIKTIEVCLKQTGDNGDLVLMLGRCHFTMARQMKDLKANTAARQMFKKAYDLGQRKGCLYEWWHQSELEADHPVGALEACELAIRDDIPPIVEWKLRRAYALHKLAQKHIESNNPQEGLVELARCAAYISEAAGKGEGSQFEQENLLTALKRINDERIDLLRRLPRDFAECERSLEAIISIVDAGDERGYIAAAAVETFARMVDRIKDEGSPGKHHIAAVRNRRRDIINMLRRHQLIKRQDKLALESEVNSVGKAFEALVLREAQDD